MLTEKKNFSDINLINLINLLIALIPFTIILGNLAYEVAKSKPDTAKITPESNAEGVMRIYNLYIIYNL